MARRRKQRTLRLCFVILLLGGASSRGENASEDLRVHQLTSQMEVQAVEIAELRNRLDAQDLILGLPQDASSFNLEDVQKKRGPR